jgi:type I restriction enzyme S subunit
MREGWVETTLGEVLDPITERAGDGTFDLVLSVTEKRGIIPQTEVFKNRIATDDVSKYKVLQSGDISFNPYLLWCGAVGQWLGYLPGVVSPVYECFRVKPNHHPRYLGLVFESGHLTPYFNSTAIGSIERRRRTTVPVFNAAPLALPPLLEQRRIVDVIESVDAYIAALEKRAETARTARSALLHDLLSNPGPDWTEMSLSDVASVDRGVAWAKDEESWTETAESVPVVRIGNIQLTGIDMTERLHICGVNPRDLERKAIRANTILMVGSNGNPERVGNAHIAGPDLDGHLYASFLIGITPSDSVLPRFLLAFLQSDGFQRTITEATSGSTGLKNIGLSWLRDTAIALPGLNDQAEIAEIATAFDASTASADATLQSARSLRAALLSDLLSGNHEIPTSYDELLGAA